MELDRCSERIPTLDALKKQYAEVNPNALYNKYLIPSLETNIKRWYEYLLQESNKIIDAINEEDGEFHGDDYTFPIFHINSSDIERFIRQSVAQNAEQVVIRKNIESIIDGPYIKYREECIKILKNRVRYDKQEEEKKGTISKFVSMYNITEEESEAVILYLSTKSSVTIREKYDDFKKNTLVALQFINRYSREKSIRFEDGLTVLLENI